jgi:hypothetical protein
MNLFSTYSSGIVLKDDEVYYQMEILKNRLMLSGEGKEHHTNN